jgi:hypothetical protein
MNEELIATLELARDALLGQLPINSIEILKAIPHPVPGYMDNSDPSGPRWVDAADWHVPDDQKGLRPALMDPCYDSAASSQLGTAISTDSVLGDLKTRYSTFRLGIVRLRGAKPPIFGGVRPDENAPAGSTAKISGLYALYQLLYEMSLLTKELSIRTISELQRAANPIWKGKGFKNNSSANRLPRLSRLFDFYDVDTIKIHGNRREVSINDHFSFFSSGPKLFFTKAVLEILRSDPGQPDDGHAPGFSNRERAGLLIRDIGYAYVASVMIQSGLFNPDVNPLGAGIWVRCDYNNGLWDDSENPRPRLPGGIQNITARSVTDFFTLLLQRRLVNQSASDEMMQILNQGGCVYIFDKDRMAGAPNQLTVIASKCGVVESENIYNDAMAVTDPFGTQSVIVVLATQKALMEELDSENDASKHDQFFEHIKTALGRFS